MKATPATSLQSIIGFVCVYVCVPVLAVAPASRVFSLWCAVLKLHPFASPRIPSAPFQPIESDACHLQLKLAQTHLVLTAVNVLKIAFFREN